MWIPASAGSETKGPEYPSSVVENSEGPTGKFYADGLTTFQGEISSEVAGSAGRYAVVMVCRKAQVGLITGGQTHHATVHNEPLVRRV